MLKSKAPIDLILKPTLKEQFPSTRYQGSKRKILPWIFEELKDIPFHSVLDGMGGTGMVSYLFKLMGKQVTFNDGMKFNSIIARALIENSTEKLSNERIEWIFTRHSDIDYDNFIARTFSNFFYTEDENEELDVLAQNISNMRSGFEQDLAFYALFQSCLIKRPFNLFHRKNLYIRTNDVARSFGNKQTWDRSFEHYFNMFAKEANDFIVPSQENHTILNSSILDVKGEYDLVYLDPPYFRANSTNETSNYSRIYHFLEGLSDYSNWDEKIDLNSGILHLENSPELHDFKPSTVTKLIEQMLDKFGKSKIVLSYKSGGVPSIDELVQMMKRIKQKVYIAEKKYSYALNSQNGHAKYNREVLIIGV